MEIRTSSSSSDAANSAALAALNNASSVENAAPVDSSAETAGASEFAAFMTKALGGSGKKVVNEEELFAALIEKRLEQQSPEAASAYRSALAENSSSMAKSDGYIPFEDAAKQALKSVVDAGKIDSAAAEKINGEAFAAAQLDANKTALYDGRGSANDPTIATAELEAALRSMEDLVTQIDSGSLSVESMSLSVASNVAGSGAVPSSSSSDAPSSASDSDEPAAAGTQALDGSGGFLWKPASDSNGNLVVLLPQSFTGKVNRVELHSSLPASEETKIEEGKYSSVANGDRAHFRFNKPGSDYPAGTYVVAYQDNGDAASWQIQDTGARND